MYLQMMNIHSFFGMMSSFYWHNLHKAEFCPSTFSRVTLVKIDMDIRWHEKSILGFVSMNLSKHKRWRALLHTVIAKQQVKIEQTHPICLHAVEKYKKVENVNMQND